MSASNTSARSRARRKPEEKSTPGKRTTRGREVAGREPAGRIPGGASDAGRSVVEELLPTITHLARKMARGFGNDYIVDDLVTAGVIALLELLQKYDPSRAKLNTFAYMRVRGAMIDELRSMDWFPRSARVKARKIQKAAARLESEMGRRPDEEEMAREMNMEPAKYLSMLKSCGSLSVVSIEEMGGESDEGRGDAPGCLVDHRQSPEGHAEARELRKIVTGELRKLSERQRKTLTLYYRDGMNMREVAATLGVTEARISQIHSQALVTLRPLMRKYLAER